MFTGLVETTGTIESITPKGDMIVLEVLAKDSSFDSEHGASIAINGCCLTVTEFHKNKFSFDVSIETIQKTNLDNLELKMEVNMERAIALGTRLGGHIVSGHVDSIAEVTEVEDTEGGTLVRVHIPKPYEKYIIDKGSITLDGVSLTVNELVDIDNGCIISLMLIPTTLEETTFKHLRPGQKLNFEFDLIGKYLERLHK